MSKFPVTLVLVALMVTLSNQAVMAYGEDVLAHTGEFTFFIKPEPGSCRTYTQKMVPCVEKKTVPQERLINQTYPVPIPGSVTKPTLITETPMGRKGKPGCLQCFPKSSIQRSAKKMVAPRIIPVNVKGVLLSPKCVSRKIMKPVWFEFYEKPAPPKRPTKVKYPRKVGPRG